jgi:CRP-like cAMP-binding protein
MRPIGSFCGATDKELALVDRLTYEFSAPPGTVLIAEGESARGFFLVVSGQVEMTVSGIPCRKLGPGMFFGETAMLDRGPEPATATAVAPSTLRVANRREFRELIRTPRIAHAMLLTLSAQQRATLSGVRLGSVARAQTDAEAPNSTDAVRA